LGTLAFSGPSYSQNFDTLASSGTTATWANGSTLEGWYLFRQPAPGTAITAYAIGTGSGNGGSFYSFGATSAADRALGGVGSGGAYFGSLATTEVPVGWIAFGAVNKTGAAITSVILDFDGEQWRNGGNTSAHAMALEYGLGGDDFTAITWTSAPASFAWTSPVVGSTAAAIDGNAAGLVDLVGGALNGLTWNVDQTLWLRWVEVNNTGSDHGLAIDNFALSVPAAAPGDMQITEYLYSGASGEYIEFTNVGGTAVDLTGWSFDDADRVPGAQSLSAFGIVQPGQSVILTEASADAFRTAWNLSVATPVIGGLTNNLGRGDEINLYDAASVLVDRLTYNDQTIPGTPRAQNASAWAPSDQLASQTIDSDWRLSTLADAQNSRSSSGSDLGNPGHFNTGAAGVLVIEADGATQLTEGGATDTYTLTLRSQPAADVIIAINGNSQVAPSTPTATFTPANWNTPQTVTLTAIDDALAEGTHAGTVSHTVTSVDANYNARAVATVAATITDNDGAPLPAVNLSVSSNTGSEAAATRITITATASAAVAASQTVSLGITGTGITASDYFLTGTTITIPAGQSSGSVSFIVADDATAEAAETATLSLSNPSAGITLGATLSQNLTITNNDASFLTKLGGATSTTASEIPAFDPGSDRVYVVAASTVNVYSMAANGSLSALPNLAPGFSAPAGTTVAPNSVAIHDGIVAVAYQVQETDHQRPPHRPGQLLHRGDRRLPELGGGRQPARHAHVHARRQQSAGRQRRRTEQLWCDGHLLRPGGLGQHHRHLRWRGQRHGGERLVRRVQQPDRCLARLGRADHRPGGHGRPGPRARVHHRAARGHHRAGLAAGGQRARPPGHRDGHLHPDHSAGRDRSQPGRQRHRRQRPGRRDQHPQFFGRQASTPEQHRGRPVPARRDRQLQRRRADLRHHRQRRRLSRLHRLQRGDPGQFGRLCARPDDRSPMPPA
jgi:hypothetical protein